jgi:eukaryotic-like serine/threonine-protein kinase
MGEVWRAEHRLLARPAAVKLIRREMLDPSPALASSLGRRFEREARATALLRSPHTVALYDYGSTPDGSFYYVMELLDGLDLHSLVQRHGPLPTERAVYLLSQAASSLAEAHAHHLVHRDVKPANIYVCQQGLLCDFVKVLDFGLVKTEVPFDSVLDANLSAEFSVCGTPAFMPPEQIWGKDAAPAGDIYSFGCVAFWLLTGRYPFRARSAMEMLVQHAGSAAPRASACAPWPVPKELDDLIAACLAKDPAARPASMLELGERLAAIPLSRSWDQRRALDWWKSHAPDALARTPRLIPSSSIALAS